MTRKKITLLLLGIIFILILIPIYTFRSQVGLVGKFLFPNQTQVKSSDGRTNFLILGIGGKDHTGGDLTDTMMFVSVNLVNPKIDIVSIPRDLWIPEIRAKANSAFHYGGVSLAKTSIEKVVGKTVHYTVLVDFSGFKEIVDAMGGINVNVENNFTDNDYPVAGLENDLCNGDKLFRCRYETVTFSQGLQKMDGLTALKFVRSRHAEGTEGTDTAREARQQKVIDAIRNKLTDPKIFLNPKTDLAIFRVLKKSLETDINANDLAIFGTTFIQGSSNIKKHLIPQDLLVNPPITKTYDKQYVFVPKLGNGKWEDIKVWVNQVLTSSSL